MRSPPRRNGYSLIELLAVIGILAVLLALTTSAVQRVRNSVRTVERASWHEQRQLGTTERRTLPLKVLFIGNSYTTTNDLPGTLAALVKASGLQPTLVVDQHCVGGHTLQQHWDEGAALKKIQSDDWDFVVLQEQSQTALAAYGQQEKFFPYSKEFVREIKARQSIPLFYMTWKRPDTPFPAEGWIDSYVQITKLTKSEVAPAGIAYERAKLAIPGWNPYADPGGHPTPAGTYLTACVFYCQLFDRDPVGLPPLLIPAAEATILQNCAREAVKDSQRRTRSVLLR